MTSGMTGFARVCSQNELGSVTWELRTVNHRYLDINLRLPESCRQLEMRLREQVKEKLQRGKFEGSLKHTPGVQSLPGLQLQEQGLAQLIAISAQVKNAHEMVAPLRMIDVLHWPGVLQEQARDFDQVHEQVMVVFQQAIEDLHKVRCDEGQQMCDFIIKRTEEMQELIGQVEQRIPQVLDQLRERLLQRCAELKLEVDQSRVQQELALLITKLDVSEELERLSMHIGEVNRVLCQNGAQGRRLDFLMQELNREANTLTSKSPDVAITKFAVELKVLIEQCREQVQNIE